MFKKFVKSIVTKAVHQTVVVKLKEIVSDILHKHWIKQILTYTITTSILIVSFVIDGLISIKFDTHHFAVWVCYIGISVYFSFKWLETLIKVFKMIQQNWNDFKKVRTIKQFLCFYALNKFQVIEKVMRQRPHVLENNVFCDAQNIFLAWIGIYIFVTGERIRTE